MAIYAPWFVKIPQPTVVVPLPQHRRLKIKSHTDILTQHDNTREAVTGQPPPIEVLGVYYFITINFPFVKKQINEVKE